ncbi:MAG: hypothetical protein JXR36_09470 [Bacteroidales bacterium]|nr:hypothetical protein [Bacteroidales bacterium]
MKRLKDFSANEKILMVMLLLSIVLVATSWNRICDKAGKVFKLYTKGEIEETR